MTPLAQGGAGFLSLQGARQIAQVPQAALIAIGSFFHDPSAMVLRA